MRRRKWLLCCALMVLAGAILGGVSPDADRLANAQAEASFGKGTLKKGARGGDVYELQGRLKYLGFYTGKIDGNFGERTYRAVRLFQYEFGMKVDGVVGPKTKRKLWEASKDWTPGADNRIYRVGDRGGYVWELQRRLRFLGFYTGKVDGVFLWRTYHAVRLFQYEFGMKVDGVVGPKTKRMLWKATRHWRPGKQARPQAPQARKAPAAKPVRSAPGISKQDFDLLARAIYSEARGEPYVGQVAVGAVILNRIDSNKFPDTLSGVIFQPQAFEAVADGQIWLEPDETAKKAAMDALNGWDPSGGALYYFNPDRAISKWIWSRPQIKRIGKHIFCK
ncbi:spore cortex-lytic enzyme [Planifilum fulgidum]|jgi:N-acetylmuramoyl-L-alanine amidase|uniref:Spore cortex-lytic enzyme n=1 Tax=Planifilum fulgidum TaxID=201973 RepID=A0A1I2MA11_9BACL|nr:spore cortex-lytic enzyme [Planifilum fulgidum]